MDDTMQITDFATTLEQLQSGRTLSELNEAITNLVMAVMQTGKGGELTLAIKVKPKGAGKILITDTIKSKLPAFERTETLFYATEEGVLSRKREGQGEIEFERDESDNEAPLRRAEGG